MQYSDDWDTELTAAGPPIQGSTVSMMTGYYRDWRRATYDNSGSQHPGRRKSGFHHSLPAS